MNSTEAARGGLISRTEAAVFSSLAWGALRPRTGDLGHNRRCVRSWLLRSRWRRG